MAAPARKKFASEAGLNQLLPLAIAMPTCIQLSGHFINIEGRVLVYQMTKYQLSLTYNASWRQRAVPNTDFTPP